MRAKKKCNINKLPRKALIIKCKGRGIAIGKLEAEIGRLQDRLIAAPNSIDVLNNFAEMDKLKNNITAKAAIIDSLREDVDDCDILLGEAQRLGANFEADNVGLRKERQQLTENISEYKKTLGRVAAERDKHDEHWRELAVFISGNLLHLSDSIKLMKTATNAINYDYSGK